MAPHMDHDTVREWIDDAFIAPGMRDDEDSTARAVRAHLATCVECGAYDEATRRAALKLDLERGPSPEVRTRTLAAAERLARARTEVPGSAPAPKRAGGLTWRLAALVLVIAVAGAGAGAFLANAVRQTPTDLADAVAMMSVLTTKPGALEIVLRDAAGNENGIAVMAPVSHELAVLVTHLPAGEYHCYVEHDGDRTWIGNMYVDGAVQFWAGEMDAAMDMHPGDMLVVALDEAAPAALTATL